ncbi:MAG: phosphogluconate dehydrogenase (NAD(+)-dependent, decarboxylating) [Candidatus Babeliales bacterium]
MKLGIVGLGRMGMAITERVLKAGYDVVAFDRNETLRKEAEQLGARTVLTASQLPEHVRVTWLMIPAGAPIDQVIESMLPDMHKGDTIIDGGNSNFHDTVCRSRSLQEHGMHFLDCGTSGGLKGREIGFSLMIGGQESVFKLYEPLFKAIAHKDGYGYMGESGAGHYVKMVHNGIEYALMQAYGEGFDLLKNGEYKELDLAKICRVWNNGGVIRSYLLELIENIFKEDQNLEGISGEVAESGMGLWTVQEAHKQHISVKLIEDALDIRKQSRETGGNFGTKVVAMLRNQFGGHSVKFEKSE